MRLYFTEARPEARDHAAFKQLYDGLEKLPVLRSFQEVGAPPHFVNELECAQAVCHDNKVLPMCGEVSESHVHSTHFSPVARVRGAISTWIDVYRVRRVVSCSHVGSPYLVVTCSFIFDATAISIDLMDVVRVCFERERGGGGRGPKCVGGVWEGRKGGVAGARGVSPPL